MTYKSLPGCIDLQAVLFENHTLLEFLLHHLDSTFDPTILWDVSLYKVMRLRRLEHLPIFLL
jgi:hypothetical protein